MKCILNTLKNKLRHKEKGELSGVCVLLFVIFCMSCMIFYIISMTRDLDTKSDLDLIFRKYLLVLESDGNLTSTQVVQLNDKIKTEIINTKNPDGTAKYNIDPSSIDITITPNTYGNEVSIDVKLKIKLQSSRFKNIFNIVKLNDVEYTEYSKKYVSISKT